MNKLIDILAQNSICVTPIYCGLQYHTWGSNDDPSVVAHWQLKFGGQVFDFYQGVGLLLDMPLSNEDKEKRDRVAEQYKALGLWEDKFPVIHNASGFRDPFRVGKKAALAPSIEDVFYTLVSDAESAEMPLQDFIDELGYEDTLQGFITYRECDRIRLRGRDHTAEQLVITKSGG
jgi:hypothetical protein